jgi:putative Mg2+ transporter-C (MgtC) family protein
VALDLTVQLDLALRLAVAAVLGGIIGLEREIHQHPAGMRTHLLVSLGSAVFTEMSSVGFGQVVTSGQATNVDPTRIAAQIVSGIGFLGAGAIIKYGTSIRGLTTAASLWVTASVGLAIGGGEYIIGVVGAALTLLSLGPLNLIVEKLRLGNEQAIRVRLGLVRLEQLARVSEELRRRRVEIAGIGSQRIARGRYEVELDVRLPGSARSADLLAALSELPDVEVIESVNPHD